MRRTVHVTKLDFGYEVIKDIDDLIKQLKSLREEAKIMLPTGEKVFKKDFIALGIIINFLEENEEELK